VRKAQQAKATCGPTCMTEAIWSAGGTSEGSPPPYPLCEHTCMTGAIWPAGGTCEGSPESSNAGTAEVSRLAQLRLAYPPPPRASPSPSCPLQRPHTVTIVQAKRRGGGRSASHQRPSIHLPHPRWQKSHTNSWKLSKGVLH